VNDLSTRPVECLRYRPAAGPFAPWARYAFSRSASFRKNPVRSSRSQPRHCRWTWVLSCPSAWL
jgi:hypothetical protein